MAAKLTSIGDVSVVACMVAGVLVKTVPSKAAVRARLFMVQS